jgi:hypothetical protein
MSDGTTFTYTASTKLLTFSAPIEIHERPGGNVLHDLLTTISVISVSGTTEY